MTSPQARRPEFLEDTRLGPHLKPVVGGAAGANVGLIQSVPRAAGTQDKENGVHGGAVVSTRPTTAELVFMDMLRQARDDPAPPIRQTHENDFGLSGEYPVAT